MSNLDKEINNLKQLTMKMGELVIENLKVALEIYYNYDKEKADLINDDVVDLHERLIEEMCLNIMVKERAFARDLREVSGILKLVEDLERLGDHAEDIKEFATKLEGIDHHQIDFLDESYKESIKMVLDSITSFVNYDLDLANKVILNDSKVDKLYDDAISYIIENTNDGKFSSAFSIYTTLVVKYIERIADHAVNIAEWVIYILNGYHKDKQIF